MIHMLKHFMGKYTDTCKLLWNLHGLIGGEREGQMDRYVL